MEDKDNLKEFIDGLKKVKGPRKHKVKNSLGVYDAYKYYRKTKPKDSKYVLTESQYFSIIRKVNDLFAEALSLGEDVIFPCRMGSLEVRKYNCEIKFDGKKVKTNFPIDWSRTLKLWYEDEESFNNKTLVKMEEKEIYKIYYNRELADFNNKSFYQFFPNRDLKKRLHKNIREGNVKDAFLLKKKK